MHFSPAYILSGKLASPWKVVTLLVVHSITPAERFGEQDRSGAWYAVISPIFGGNCISAKSLQ
jgi:hypothetical protein